MHTLVQLLSVLLLVARVLYGSPVSSTALRDGGGETEAGDGPINIENSIARVQGPTRATSCFPAIGFKMPQQPPWSLDGWWCDWKTEYAFLGFSYEVSACQSANDLARDFTDIRKRFRGRYVRIYGNCDRKGFYDDVIHAAWQAGVGIHALIWFGFNGDNVWMSRRDKLMSTLHSNPLAKFVVRAVQFGSEPLFDNVLSAADLAREVRRAKSQLSGLRIPVTVSDMAYAYRERDGGNSVMSAIDFVDAHILPFFDQRASTAKNAWPIVQGDLGWFVSHAHGKKIIFSQTGWPSVTSSGVKPNSDKAVANVRNERDYYDLLDAQCPYFKTVGGGGVGWFAHLYSDNQEPGYGIYDYGGNLKFPFNPRMTC